MPGSSPGSEWVPAAKRLEQILPGLCERFGLPSEGATVRPVARGAMGRLWRLDTGTGEAYAVKELLWGKAEHDVLAEISFRNSVLGVGISAPECIPGVDGEYMTGMESESGEIWVRLFSWIEGGPVSASDPDTADWLGQALGRMHGLRIPPMPSPYLSWYRSAPDPQIWEQIVDKARRADAPWCAELRERLGLVLELTAQVVEPDSTGLITCHLDLKPDNVLRRPDGTHVLLDWDDVGPSTADRELASALVRWHVHEGKVDGDGVARTVDAYRQVHGPARMRPTSFAMQLAMSLNHLRGLADAMLGPLPSGGDGYMHTEFLATLRSLPTQAVLDRVLEAASA
ncbi:phosphotransferase enzyme family protein [Streptomyces sp. bgisy153]|uniref:phosphotransferase enzyme family protein n=1 Tax=Streptomyces sp. bgisy153 TaxID=3413793 RepID=UPI003D71E043